MTNEQPHSGIAALADRLATQLDKEHKKKPFILDLTLPSDAPCPLGAWLSDRISESLADRHPEFEVIDRKRWILARAPNEFAHDLNQERAQNAERARSLGAEVLVQGNVAAVPGGIGITLIASDQISGGESRFEALAEIPFTAEMQSLLLTPLPERATQDGAVRAGVAGVGSPLCEFCPVPEYTYMAKARKLQGVVIAQLAVATDGTVQNVKIIRTPHPALGSTAIRTVQAWRFKPAQNFRGESVPVIVDVAVSFRLGLITKPAASITATSSAKSESSATAASAPH